VAGSATYAYFSSTATMSGNTFTAGTMALKIDDNIGGTPNWVSGFDITSDQFKNDNSANWHNDQTAWNTFLKAFGLSDLYPGMPVRTQELDIKNDGTVDGFATIKIDAMAWSTSTMGDDLNFAVYYDASGAKNNYHLVDSGSLSAWNHNVHQLGSLNAGNIGNVVINWSVPASAGNEIQGATASVNTTFGLNQVVNQVN
jgi:predicted ribosomally synthesized peptide with SipW-like signal peptide